MTTQAGPTVAAPNDPTRKAALVVALAGLAGGLACSAAMVSAALGILGAGATSGASISTMDMMNGHHSREPVGSGTG